MKLTLEKAQALLATTTDEEHLIVHAQTILSCGIDQYHLTRPEWGSVYSSSPSKKAQTAFASWAAAMVTRTPTGAKPSRTSRV